MDRSLIRRNVVIYLNECHYQRSLHLSWRGWNCVCERLAERVVWSTLITLIDSIFVPICVSSESINLESQSCTLSSKQMFLNWLNYVWRLKWLENGRMKKPKLCHEVCEWRQKHTNKRVQNVADISGLEGVCHSEKRDFSFLFDQFIRVSTETHSFKASWVILSNSFIFFCCACVQFHCYGAICALISLYAIQKTNTNPNDRQLNNKKECAHSLFTFFVVSCITNFVE